MSDNLLMEPRRETTPPFAFSPASLPENKRGCGLGCGLDGEGGLAATNSLNFHLKKKTQKFLGENMLNGYC